MGELTVTAATTGTTTGNFSTAHVHDIQIDYSLQGGSQNREASYTVIHETEGVLAERSHTQNSLITGTDWIEDAPAGDYTVEVYAQHSQNTGSSVTVYYEVEEEEPALGGGSEADIDVSPESGGRKHVTGGSEVELDVAPEGGGQKSAFDGSAVITEVSIKASGLKESYSGSECNIEVELDGAGHKIVSGDSEVIVSILIEGSGEVAIPVPDLTATDMEDHVFLEWEVA